jgi:hypothetical protein
MNNSSFKQYKTSFLTKINRTVLELQKRLLNIEIKDTFWKVKHLRTTISNLLKVLTRILPTDIDKKFEI